MDTFARTTRGVEHAAAVRALIAGRQQAGERPDHARVLRLQRDAGNRAVVQLLQARPDGGGARKGALGIPVQRRPTAAERRRRKRATELKAADARTLLQASVPFVLDHMTEDQVGQMQRVLDAAVVNPEVKKEADELYRRSVIAESGGYANRDPAMVRRAERVMEKDYVPISDADRRIRLDFEALLSSDALSPRTDNPDENAYLTRVRNTLAAKGVWLRFGQPFVRDPEDPSRHIIDPRQFQAWLSLGPDGDTIPTKSGELTRDALLGTTLLGAGYYEHVDLGPVQAAIDHEVNRLIGNIESGVEQHNMLARIRDDAFFGVAEISDLLGGADFPDRSIWDQPHKLVLRAMEMNVGGNVAGAQAFLVVAAVVTRSAAHLLSQYIDDSSTGVERAVTVLKVAKTAGEVAEAGLAVTGVTGLARGALSLGAGEAGAAAVASDVDVAAEQLTKRYMAKNGIHADELAEVRWVRGPKGTVSGGVKPGTSSGAGTGWHKWP